ncbi:OmpA family protein [Cellulomonas xiejunii]|uniref:OmpA family protein n=1 Tax=Cellulomonas xiejunii TaxID=2968083 RepID=A0ABY5KR40_9CELL|nr:OmpA family protein [Cellulomonas xiejunii]MCC2321647.1 OmpA family protein [Cellulomonas xiejunii]UUI72961.1 OmpA family protein [Cellulomonas xiejunii]
MTSRLRVLLGVPLAAVLAAGAASSPSPVLTPGDFPEATARDLEYSVRALDPDGIGYNTVAFAEYARVRPLATQETTAEETVVSLATDILFQVDDAALSPAAGAEVGRLLADVPSGAAVVVEGHTDTVASDDHNQQLSERRAATVAEAVRASRADLSVTAQGFGETRPKVEESGDDVAEDRAQNRRVELRFTADGTPDPAAVATPTPSLDVPPRTDVEPRVRVPAEQADSVAQTRVPSPAYPGVDIVVDVEGVEVRGAVTELSLLLSLDGDVPQDAPHLYDALDGRSWDMTLVDRAALLQYPELKRHGQIDWLGEGRVVGTRLTSVHRFVLTFPRLLSDEGPVDVVLDAALPPVADVPVTRE